MAGGINTISRRRWLTGDLRHFISLQERSVQPGFTDHGEAFTTLWQVRAAVQTLASSSETGGRTQFDGLNVNRAATHIFIIRHLDGVTAEHWVLMGNKRYDILAVEAVDERGDFLRLVANERGAASLGGASL